MISKYIFSSLLLTLITQSAHTMQAQKPSTLSQIMTVLRQKNDAHRKRWIEGYKAHSQQKKAQDNAEITQGSITPATEQKPFSKEDIYAYLWMNPTH